MRHTKNMRLQHSHLMMQVILFGLLATLALLVCPAPSMAEQIAEVTDATEEASAHDGMGQEASTGDDDHDEGDGSIPDSPAGEGNESGSTDPTEDADDAALPGVTPETSVDGSDAGADSATDVQHDADGTLPTDDVPSELPAQTGGGEDAGESEAGQTAGEQTAGTPAPDNTVLIENAGDTATKQEKDLTPELIASLFPVKSATKSSTRRPVADGTYVIKSDLALKLVLSAVGKKTVAGANVRIATYKGTNNQKWVVAYDKKLKYYRLYVAGSGNKLALGIQKSGKTVNVCVLSVSKHKTDKYILWSFKDTGLGSYCLVNPRYTKRRLDVAGSKAKSGTNVALVKKKSVKKGSNQRFEVYSTSPKVKASSVKVSGSYQGFLEAKQSLAVSLKKNSAIVSKATSSLNQRLYLQRDSKGFYTVWIIGTGKVLDVAGGSVLPGTNVQQAKSTGKANQKWAVVSVKMSDGSKVVTLQNKGTGLYLGTSKASSGANLVGVKGSDSTKYAVFRLSHRDLINPGIYEIKPTSTKTLSLHVAKDLSDNSKKGSLNLATDKNGLSQRFELIDASGTNTFRIRTASSGGWVTWNGGTSIVQMGKGADAATSANTWKLSYKNGAFNIANVASGLSIDTKGNSIKKGVKILAAAKGSAASQRFAFERATLCDNRYVSLQVPSGYQLKAGSSEGKAAKLAAASTATMAQAFYIEQHGCTNKIRDYKGRYLTATEAEAGSGVTTTKSDAALHQSWLLKIADGGHISIAEEQTGLALSNSGNAMNVGLTTTVWALVDRTIDAMRERIAQVATHFAEDDNHGYSQPNRGTGGKEAITIQDGSQVTICGGDVDCSELVRHCVNSVIGYDAIEFMWTGNEDALLRAHGFKRIAFSPSEVQRGDILWYAGHTGVALGDGLQSDAYSDENGSLYGPRRGDQTGWEIAVRTLFTGAWTYIYRYVG